MKKTVFIRFHKAFPIIIFILFSLAIINNPGAAISGARNGLVFTGETVIPCLFPFTVGGIFLYKSGGIFRLSQIFDRFSRPILKLSGKEFAIFLLSLIGGYPMGAKLIGEMKRQGEITTRRAQFLLTFCVNASPTFFISAIGVGIFSSKTIGLILFMANILSSITCIYIFYKFSGKDLRLKSNHNTSFCFGDSLVLSVKETSEIFLNISGFIVLFSTLNSLVGEIITSRLLKLVLGIMFEVTTACNMASKDNLAVYFYSFIISFGGLSTIFQILTCLSECSISFAYLFLTRVFQGLFSSFYTYILFKLFPVLMPTYATHKNLIIANATPSISTLSLLVLGILYLIYINRCFLRKNT